VRVNVDTGRYRPDRRKVAGNVHPSKNDCWIQATGRPVRGAPSWFTRYANSSYCLAYQSSAFQVEPTWVPLAK
jgi:hypothetical protein